jgi:16S rRNA (cytosine967-C5)-methyltransferase
MTNTPPLAETFLHAAHLLDYQLVQATADTTWQQTWQAFTEDCLDYPPVGCRTEGQVLAWLQQRKPALQHHVYLTLRHLGQVQAIVAHLVKQPPPTSWISALLWVAIANLCSDDRAPDHVVVDQAVVACQLDHTTAWLKGMVNGVLRRFLRERDAILAAIADQPRAVWNFPDEWVQQVQRHYPQQWQTILTAGQTHPPMTLRVNPRHVEGDDYGRAYGCALSDAGLSATPVLAQRMWQLDAAISVQRLPAFETGGVSVQDAAAAWAIDWLDMRDGLSVLDACAAPGGKTAAILERYQPSVMLVLDSDRNRLHKVDDNLTRLGLHTIPQQLALYAGDAAYPQQWPAWTHDMQFDRILADVPCSGSGVVRRHPEQRWNELLTQPLENKHSRFGKLIAEQRAILLALWDKLAPNGKLVYVTCSIWPEEGEDQIAWFLQQHPEAKRLSPFKDAMGGAVGQIVPEQYPTASGQIPALGLHDGFFYAVLSK